LKVEETYGEGFKLTGIPHVGSSLLLVVWWN